MTQTSGNIIEGLQPLAVPVDELKNWDKNPRRGEVNAVAKSYETFGQRKPIVARRDGTVIAGNHQLAAARLLGWSHIAVVYVDDDDATAKAFAIADNQTSDLATNDEEVLASLVRELKDEATLLEATALGEESISALLAGLEEPKEPTNHGRGLGTPIISYVVVFDDADQQKRWFDFLRWLKSNVDGETMAERLDKHLSGTFAPT